MAFILSNENGKLKM